MRVPASILLGRYSPSSEDLAHERAPSRLWDLRAVSYDAFPFPCFPLQRATCGVERMPRLAISGQFDDSCFFTSQTRSAIPRSAWALQGYWRDHATLPLFT